MNTIETETSDQEYAINRDAAPPEEANINNKDMHHSKNESHKCRITECRLCEEAEETNRGVAKFPKILVCSSLGTLKVGYGLGAIPEIANISEDEEPEDWVKNLSEFCRFNLWQHVRIPVETIDYVSEELLKFGQYTLAGGDPENISKFQEDARSALHWKLADRSWADRTSSDLFHVLEKRAVDEKLKYIFDTLFKFKYYSEEPIELDMLDSPTKIIVNNGKTPLIRNVDGNYVYEIPPGCGVLLGKEAGCEDHLCFAVSTPKVTAATEQFYDDVEYMIDMVFTEVGKYLVDRCASTGHILRGFFDPLHAPLG